MDALEYGLLRQCRCQEWRHGSRWGTHKVADLSSTTTGGWGGVGGRAAGDGTEATEGGSGVSSPIHEDEA